MINAKRILSLAEPLPVAPNKLNAAFQSPLPLQKSSSMEKYSSRPLCLISFNRAVAMFVCLSINFLCSCNFGNDSTALVNLAVLAPV